MFSEFINMVFIYIDIIGLFKYTLLRFPLHETKNKQYGDFH